MKHNKVDVQKLMQPFSSLINQFHIDQKDYLVGLFSGAIVPDSFADGLQRVDEAGRDCFDQFVETRLVHKDVPFHAPLISY